MINKKKFIFTILALTIFIITLEIFSRLLLQSPPLVFQEKSILYHTIHDDQLGYKLPPSQLFNAKKVLTNGSIIYNVQYTTDINGRRVVGQKRNTYKKHLLLLGGSGAYGEGLNDNETLQFLLGTHCSQFNIFNFGVHGYGPQHILQQLSMTNLSQEVFGPQGVAIYIFIYDHILRAIGSTRTPWLLGKTPSGPIYQLSPANDLIRRNTFKYESWYSLYLLIKNHSYFLKKFAPHLPLSISSHDLNLVLKIITEMKHRYTTAFKGEFYVLFHPNSQDNEIYRSFYRILKKNNFKLLTYPEIIPKEQHYIEYDLHPSALLNKILAPKLCHDLKSF